LSGYFIKREIELEKEREVERELELKREYLNFYSGGVLLLIHTPQLVMMFMSSSRSASLSFSNSISRWYYTRRESECRLELLMWLTLGFQSCKSYTQEIGR
jgi:ABC-type spermidine/putrescine transport system permease subunit II